MPLQQIHHGHERNGHSSLRSFVMDQLRLAKLGRKLLAPYGQLSGAAKRLLAAHGLYILYAILTNTFVNVYLYRQGEDFRMPAVFHLAHFASSLAVFWAVAGTSRRPKAKRLMQAGILVTIIRFLVFLVYGVHDLAGAANVGLIAGIGLGLYWSGYHSLTYVITGDGQRDRYFGLRSALMYLLSVIAPAMGGLLLSRNAASVAGQGFSSSYGSLFSLISLILLIGFFLTGRLPDMRVATHQAGHVLSLMKQRRWRFILLRELLDGLYTGAIGFLGIIMAFLVLNGSELDLGIFSSLFAVASAVASLLLGGLLIKGEKDRVRYGIIGASLMALAAAIYVGLFNWTGIIISACITVLAGPLFGVGMSATFYHAIERSARHEKDYFAYVVLRETALQIGRFISLILFILTLGTGANLQMAKGWYLALSVMPLAFCLLTGLADRQEPAKA